ncbi:MAG: MFS transporter [Pseudomonadota bacterium]|nr:MFS transporter [Rubrivivax sp.]
MPAGAAAPALTWRMKWAFGLGSTAEAVVITTTSAFLMLFYNQVRGLDPAAIGIALAIGLAVNAVFDPLVGSWSDRTRSRWGRRHPFMFGAILPAALLFCGLFNPPDGLSAAQQLVWLTFFNVMLLQAMTVFHTPHLALGGEMSDDYLERSSIMGVNTFFLWIGDTAGWLLCFLVFFRANEKFPNGALDPSRWEPFSITIALIVLACLFVSSQVTKRRIPYLVQPAAATPRFGAREWGRDVWRVLRNRNYFVLLLGLFFLSMMTGVRGGLWIYNATYFWQLRNDQLAFFTVGSFFGYVFAAFCVKWLHDRFDKRWTGMLALVIYCVGPALPLALGYAGVLSARTPGLLWMLIGFSLLQHAPYSILTTTVYSALADIADENELKYGIRQEGALYATRTLFARVDQALGTALAGWVLSWIAFPARATPGQVSEPVLMGLAAAFVLSTIPGLIAAVFYGMLNVTRATHDATRQALEARRRPEPAGLLPKAGAGPTPQAGATATP